MLNTGLIQVGATFVQQDTTRTDTGNRVVIDGEILDAYRLPFAFVKAKDSHDDLEREIQRKITAGYPNTNIFFYTRHRGVLYQNGQNVLDVELIEPKYLIAALQSLFSDPLAAVDNWHAAVAEFRGTVPALGRELTESIQDARRTHPRFRTVFTDFYERCEAKMHAPLAGTLPPHLVCFLRRASGDEMPFESDTAKTAARFRLDFTGAVLGDEADR